jgi:hypothetical protein
MVEESGRPPAGKGSWRFGCLFLIGGLTVMLLAAQLGGNWFILAGGLWFLIFVAIHCRVAHCASCGQLRVFVADQGNWSWMQGAKCPICGTPYRPDRRTKS